MFLSKKRYLVVVLALVVMLWSVSVFAAGKARNVILFIGDGMGTAQRTLAYYYLGDHPIMNQMEVVGMYTTHMADGYVTDSAAAATAMATGVKTYDGAIGVDMNKQPPKPRCWVSSHPLT